MCNRCRSHALPRDSEWPTGPVVASTADAGWGSPPPAGRNAHSTPANILSPETHWRLPESTLLPDADVSPSDLALSKNCVQCALSLGENKPISSRFPVPAMHAPVVSADRPGASLLYFLRAAVAPRTSN